MKIDNSIKLGVGYISWDKDLGKYYQDFTPAINHIEKEEYSLFDEERVPYLKMRGLKIYSPIVIIQYGLMSFDLYCDKKEEKDLIVLKRMLLWLEENKSTFKDSIVWRSSSNQQYNLPDGWVSGMYQGQAISLYLRAYQLFNNITYLETAKKIYNSFKYDFNEGGFKRIDEFGCIWFEEYPTTKPSYVLNGFIYSMLGILDYHRVTGDESAKALWNSCVNTLKINLGKYDVWYWSVYDQLKEQLVSYYYQKNVHIPLMQIMFELTNEAIFDKYALKWDRNLKNPLHLLFVKLMYRVQPRLKKLTSKLK